MIAQTIVWHEYPKEKPEKDICDLLLMAHKDHSHNIKDTVYFSPGYDYVWWKERDVYLWSYKPIPIDPTAPLNFATALLRMKAGKVCRSLDSETEYIVKDGELFANYDPTDDRYCLTLSLAEIEGTWEVTE